MIEEIEILNFRSILGRSHSGTGTESRLSVDDDITTLIGENEAGKSNILKAINRFRDESPVFREDLSNYEDYAGEEFGDIEIIRCLLFEGVKGDVDETTGTIRWLEGPYTTEDVANVPGGYSINEIGEDGPNNLTVSSAIKSGQPEIITYASGDHRITFKEVEDGGSVDASDSPGGFPISISDFVNRRLEEHTLLCRWYIINALNIDGASEIVLGENIDDIEIEPTDNKTLDRGRIQNSLEIIASEFGETSFGNAAEFTQVEDGQEEISTEDIARSAEELLVTFQRLHSTDAPIDNLPTIVDQMEIDLADSEYNLIEDKNSPVLRGLFKLGGIRFKKYDSFESPNLIRDLESAFDNLSNHLNSFWKFDPTRRDRQDDIAEAEDELYEFNFDLEGIILQISLSKDGELGVPLAERSDGMRWIITFLLAILAQPYTQSGGQRSIILLDDPGIHLHPEAEKLLYRAFFYVVTEAQIIYTTHSPALVDHREPDHLRVVKHQNTEDHRGTTIANNLMEAKDEESQIDVLAPAREALGWTLDDFLFHGENTILVEGISDKRYLQLFNQSFSFEDERSFLEGDPTFIDSGGDRSRFLSRILEAENVNHVILRDDDISGEDFDERIASRTLHYRDIFGSEYSYDYEAEIEDIIDTDLIVEKVSEMHPDDFDKESVKEHANGRNRPIIDLLNSYLPADNEIDKGKLSEKVEHELHENLREGTGRYSETTERFHIIIKRLIEEFD